MAAGVAIASCTVDKHYDKQWRARHYFAKDAP
jgi:hypothetical protein